MNNKTIKSLELNLNYSSAYDLKLALKQIANKIIDGFEKDKGTIRGNNFSFNVVDCSDFDLKIYTPIRTEIINSKKCAIFASKMNDL